MQRKAEDEVSTKAEILTQTMNAVRSYTSEHVAPLLQKQLETSPKFISETVPAYSALEVFENFRNQPEYCNYIYKEATLNPTNLRDKADEFEATRAAISPVPTLKLSGYRNIVESTSLYGSPQPSLRRVVLQCIAFLPLL